ncbi:MAG: hypothetical protein JXB04_12045 [Kiritimatiellae bacterium]|nr:hypothetical protein [Kiritimatiellia bacterium]
MTRTTKAGRRQKKPLKGVLLRLAVSAVSIIVVLLLVEVVLQLVDHGTTIDRWAVPHKRYGFINRPTFQQEVRPYSTNITWTVSINSMGMRGPEYDLERPGVFKVLLLGDSFTFGYGTDQANTFSARLEDLLNETGVEAYVLNTGVTGWGTVQELLYARDHLEEFDPDVIVLTFCENDQIDDEVFLRGGADGLLPNFRGKRWIRDHSKLYTLFYEAVYQRLYARLFNRRVEDAKSVESPVNNQVAQPIPLSRTIDIVQDEWWKRTDAAIKDFRDHYLSVNPAGVMLVQSACFWRPDITQQLEYIADRDDLRFVDLTTDISDRNREELLLSYDPHWNETMHEIVAQRLFREIQAIRDTQVP